MFPTRERYPACQDRSARADLSPMIFDGSHALRFINQARAATGLPALTELPFTGAVRVDERGCLLARALQAEVGGSADPRFSDHFVVRLGDHALARAVAGRTGQPCNDRAEVLLPEPLARLAVAFDRGQVKRIGARYVAPGQLSFDDLEIDVCQAAQVVGDLWLRPSTKKERHCSTADSWPTGFSDRPRDHSSSSTTSSRGGDAGGRFPRRTRRRRLGRASVIARRTSTGSRWPAPAAARTTAVAVTASAASAAAPRPGRSPGPDRVLRPAQAERPSYAPRADTRPLPSRRRREPAPAPLRHALSAAHRDTSSAARGGRPAVSGPGRNGLRPGPPASPTTHGQSMTVTDVLAPVRSA